MGGLGVAAALGDTSGMGLGWADWIRFILTPIVLGSIAAIVATKNAKKTPHERLKNLVDIHDKMPAGLDSSNVVEAAIVRELVDFDRRVAADQKGFWAGVRERFAQFGGPALFLVALVLCTGGLLVVLVAVLQDVKNNLLPVLPAMIATVVVIIGLFGGFRSSRTERKSLNLDRAAAYISATFARAAIQDLASRELLSSQDVEEIVGEAAPRLERMGVFESDSSSGGLRVTPFGTDAINRSLRNANLRYFAHMRAALQTQDDESGREAPE